MKLEDILKKFLPSTISPKSIESLADNIDRFGKIGAGLLALLYVTGLIIFGLYHSSLHIRSIELFKVRYLFVGFYYLTFLFLHLAFPQWWLKRFWQKIVYLLVMLVVVVFLNDVHMIYLTYLVDNWTSGTSYFEFSPDHQSILNGNLILLVGIFLFTPFLFGSAIRMAKSVKTKQLFLLFALIFNYSVFTMFVFPYIPDAIGGGQAPIVNIVFDKDVPYAVTNNFDISGNVPGFVSPYYYGRLVYMDDNSIFLQEPFWFANDVYEIQRDDIIMMRYTDFNPAEMGQPGLFP